MHQRVLLVGDFEGPLRPVLGVLERFSVESLRVPTGELSLQVARDLPVDLLLVAHPIAGLRFDAFVRRFRRTELASLGTRVLVLASARNRRRLEEYVDIDLTIVSRDQPTERLERAISAHLRRAPRLRGRHVVKMEIDTGDGKVRRVFQTENLSESGLFVCTRGQFDIGARFSFELALSSDVAPICGTGEVARIEREAPGQSAGIGIRFINLGFEERRRLHAYLENRLPSEEP